MEETPIWGYNFACYNGLSQGHIQQLEKSIQLGYYGFDTEAINILRVLQVQTHSHPAVLVEWACIYYRMGLENQAAKLLATFTPPVGHQKPSIGADWWDLISIMRAIAEFYAAGAVSSALSTALELYYRLVKRSASSLSSIEALCHKFCTVIFTLSRNTGNFQEEANQFAYMDTALRKLRASMIRSTLANSGQVNLATYLALDEPDFYSGRERLKPFEELWDAKGETEFRLTSSNLVHLANLALNHAHELMLLGHKEEAQNYLHMAEQYFFSGLRVNTAERLRTAAPRQWVLMCRIFAQIDPAAGQLEACRQQMHLAEWAEHYSCYRTARLHLIDAMNQLHRKADGFTDADISRDLLVSLSDLCLDFEEHRVGSAFFLATAIVKYKGIHTVTSEPAVIKETITRFRERFPRFDSIVSTGLLDWLYNMAVYCIGEQQPSTSSTANVPHQDDNGSGRGDRLEVDPESVTQRSFASDMMLMLTKRAFIGSEPPRDSNQFDKQVAYMMDSASCQLFWFVKSHLADGNLSLEEAALLLHSDGTGNTRRPSELSNTSLSYKHISHLSVSDIARNISRVVSSQSADHWRSWYAAVKTILERSFPDFPATAPSPHGLMNALYYSREILLRNMNLTDTFRQFNHEDICHQLYLDSLKLLQRLESSNSSTVNEVDLFSAELAVACNTNALSNHEKLRLNGVVTEDMMVSAFNSLERLRNQFLARDDLANVYRTTSALSYNMQLRRWHFNLINMERCLFYLGETDKTFRRMQAERSGLGPARSFEAKDILSETLGHDMCYDSAISLIFDSLWDQDLINNGYMPPENQYVSLKHDFISWVQGFKARNLTDLLGLETRVSENFLEPISDTSQAKAMLIKEQELKSRLQTSSISARLKSRNLLEQHVRKMWSSFPKLRPMLGVRDGKALTVTDIDKLGQQLGKNVVFVDWFYLRYSEKTETNLGMALFREGRLERICTLSTKLTDIQEWIHGNFDGYDTPLDSESFICELDSLQDLVAPLAKYTAKDETLVLCPTRDLYRLPLHAAPIEGKRLIERNPVTYIQSLSLFRLCHSAQAVYDQRRNPTPFRASLFNAVERQTQGTDLMTRLGNTVAATLYSGRDCTKRNLEREIPQCALLHIHSHVEFDDKVPLKHAIILNERSSEQLTASELCDAKFHNPSIVTIMGCNSGRARISQCNDLLGLTAALHFAGVSTVISTLWKVFDGDSLTFSTAFYTSFMTQLRSKGRSKVNLAKAMQDGVQAVMYDIKGILRPPFHWAAFFLHGSIEFLKISILE